MQKNQTVKIIKTSQRLDDEYDSPESIKQWKLIFKNDLLFDLCSQPFDCIPDKSWKMIKG